MKSIRHAPARSCSTLIFVQSQIFTSHDCMKHSSPFHMRRPPIKSPPALQVHVRAFSLEAASLPQRAHHIPAQARQIKSHTNQYEMNDARAECNTWHTRTTSNTRAGLRTLSWTAARTRTRACCACAAMPTTDERALSWKNADCCCCSRRMRCCAAQRREPDAGVAQALCDRCSAAPHQHQLRRS